MFVWKRTIFKLFENVTDGQVQIWLDMGQRAIRKPISCKETTIEGTVENNIPKVISIDGYDVNLILEGLMGIIKYVDLPGTIGTIGSILGKYNINIGEMQVGRKSAGGEAVMVLKVDQEITDEAISELEQTKDIEVVKSVIL